MTKERRLLAESGFTGRMRRLRN